MVQIVSPRPGFVRRTHCIHGHEYTPENTHEHVDKNGRLIRWCRTCMRESDRQRRERERLGKIHRL